MMYDKAFFDQPFDRRGTACVKWDVMEKNVGPDLNPMWVADMDFVGPEEITQAMVKRAAHPAYGYTEQTEAATQAMIDFMKRRHNVTITAEEQIMLPCVITGLRSAVTSFTQPGDKVIIQPPVYGPFFYSATDNERPLAECPLHCDEKGYYTMDLEAVEKACQNGAKLMMLCNPHNPVGRAWTRQELTELWNLLKRYDVLLVSDEIHEDFVYEKGAFTSMLNVATGENDKVVTLTSVSKTFNLAGLQQAVAFSHNKELLAAMNKTMHNAGVTCGNIFGLVASEAAYRYGDAWLDGMLAYIHEGEQILREELAARLPEAILTPLEATYLGWIDLKAYGFNVEELRTRTREAGVEFTGGTFFGEEAGEYHVRINLACQHERIRLAAQQLEKAIKG